MIKNIVEQLVGHNQLHGFKSFYPQRFNKLSLKKKKEMLRFTVLNNCCHFW